MRVHWLQHVEYEDLGCIAPVLARRGDVVTGSVLCAGEPLPRLSDFDALIVMGGPMNVYAYDEHPWLRAEKALIRDAIGAGKPVLGICLGSQLIACALGAKVTPNDYAELGFFEVRVNEDGRRSRFFAGFPERFDAFHWHGDTFTIPEGGRNLMSSEGCVNQALEFGERVVGIQFHLEVTAADARRWFERGRPDPGRYVQSPDAVLARLDDFAANNRLMVRLLENWLN